MMKLFEKGFEKTIKQLGTSILCFFVLVAILIASLFFVPFETEAASDTTPPVIELEGFAWIILKFGSTYIDAGATATDDVDGDLTTSIVTFNPVDTNYIKTYTVTYNVTDEAGNNALPVTRTVIVADTIAPSTPAASPLPGEYTGNQSISLSSFDNESGLGNESGLNKIYYTVDGTTPTKTSSNYINPIVLDEDTTIKAIAYDKAGNHSNILEAFYEIKEPKDDKKKDDDDKKKKKDKDEEEVSAVTTTRNNSNADTNENATENKEVQGVESNPQISAEQPIEPEVKTDDKKHSSFWWWLLGILALALLYLILKRKKKKK